MWQGQQVASARGRARAGLRARPLLPPPLPTHQPHCGPHRAAAACRGQTHTRLHVLMSSVFAARPLTLLNHRKGVPGPAGGDACGACCRSPPAASSAPECLHARPLAACAPPSAAAHNPSRKGPDGRPAPRDGLPPAHAACVRPASSVHLVARALQSPPQGRPMMGAPRRL